MTNERADSRHRQIVEAMSDGVTVISRTGVILFANPAYVRLFGYEREEEMKGLHLEALLFPEDQERFRERWPAYLLAGAPAARQVNRYRARDGRELWISVATVRLVDQGSEDCVLGVLTDITERRTLEAKLQHGQKLESLGALAGGIAHDFNNLLVGVLGNASLVRSGLPADSPMQESLEGIELAATKAAALTRQLLAYAGKGRFVIGPVSLQALVEEAGAQLATMIGKGVALRHEFGEGVPEVNGDAAQLSQVVMSLLTNASDAIGDRSGAIIVRTSVASVSRAELEALLHGDTLEPGPHVCLEVVDTGSGMSEDTRSRIFDPFFTTKFVGRGLGLAATLGIMRAHHGAIQVSSALGHGTTFRLFLPVAQPVAARAPAPSPALQAGSGTVLLVDDEPGVLSVMRRVLKRAGYEVLTAEDGVQALELFTLHRSRIRGVVLDVTMPRMGGEETFRRLRELEPSVQVLLSSGFSEQEATSHFTGKGLAGFVQKPFKPEALIEKVRALVAASQPIEITAK